MNWSALDLNAAAFAVALIAMYFVFRLTLRKKACFAMYAVRDDLVYLVASGKLDEDGRVFRHYYDRVNAILSAAPNIGLDNMLETIFTKWTTPQDFAGFLDQADKKAQRLFRDAAFNDAAVRCAVADYCSGVRNMILAHSSTLRILYVVVRHLAGSMRMAILRSLPGEYGRALQAAEYANHEADLIRGATAHG
jgi:hypothetical protein